MTPVQDISSSSSSSHNVNSRPSAENLIYSHLIFINKLTICKMYVLVLDINRTKHSDTVPVTEYAHNYCKC